MTGSSTKKPMVTPADDADIDNVSLCDNPIDHTSIILWRHRCRSPIPHIMSPA